MPDIVTAVYENGILRPVQPLNLRERQTVRLQVLPDEPTDEMDLVLQALVAAGLITPPPGHSDVTPISDKERHRLARRLGQAPGKPLSEIIIEERGPW
ncbi:MAG: antitoxin family protein [Chloroflexi bacterium]|nr:antitoxin family protein [Chloroflexota bacterium]MBU1748849.1 antitoxin family protein [Chloroflexota bacterium]